MAAFSIFPGRFLRIRVAYEDLVVGALGLALVLLAGFCVGVERGKHLSGLGFPLVAEAPLGVATAGENGPEARVPPSAAEPMPVIPAAAQVLPPRDLEGRYVIQLASYAGPETARRELPSLRGMGVTAEVVSQGRYHELRAVGFKSRSQAQRVLADLRKRYPDAFIKQLSSKSS